MSEQTAITVNTEEIKKEVLPLAQRAEAFTIRDDEDYAEAGETLKAIEGVRKKLKETFAPVIDSAHKAHKAAIAAHKMHDEPLEAAGKVLRQKTALFFEERQAEERRRREEELRIQREAEEKRRAEEAERLRIEAEAMREQNRHVEAEIATQQAQAVVEAPIVVVAPVVAAAPKVDGLTMVDTWDFEIVDASLIPRQYLIPNETAIRGVVKSLKESANIPGVRVIKKQSARVRA